MIQVVNSIFNDGSGKLPSSPHFVIAEDKYVTEAQAEGDDARQRIEALIKALPGEGAECERRFTLHVRRPLDPVADLAEGIEDLFVSANCCCHWCCFCWRRRLVRTIRRAASCLLDDNEADTYALVMTSPDGKEDRQIFTTQEAARQALEEHRQRGDAARVEHVKGRLRPRLGAVYVAETTWDQWPEIDRALRKQLPEKAGRLRVRCRDDSVIIVAELPFDGACCVSPAEGAELATSAIERLHVARHSFRMLGSWADKKRTSWEMVRKLPVVLDFATAATLVDAIGAKSKRLREEVKRLYDAANRLEPADPATGGTQRDPEAERLREEATRIERQITIDARRLVSLPGFLIRSASLLEAHAIGLAAEQSILKSLTVPKDDSSLRPNFPTATGGDGFAPGGKQHPDDFDPGDPPWRT